MGGKGQRRREKNYKAAHGGYARLPPPPKSTDLDAIPSKLRRLMDFTTTTTNASPSSDLPTQKEEQNHKKKRKRDAVDTSETKPNAKDDSVTQTNARKAGVTDEKLNTPRHDFSDEDGQDKKKAKRKKKKKQATDLRFEEIDKARGSGSSKRKERKKKYLKAKKNKHKKGKMEEGLDFPGHEKIKFGEVVDAPLKLSAVPKGLKTVQDASHERLRLQAVEAYRNRKGWVSRPGIQLPPVIANAAL